MEPSLEPVATGVWLLRGGVPRTMGAFLIEDDGGGVTLFDTGSRSMSRSLTRAAGRHSMHLDRFPPPARVAYPWLQRMWDGGPVRVAGTIAEGEDVSGFRVVHLPGHGNPVRGDVRGVLERLAAS